MAETECGFCAAWAACKWRRMDECLADPWWTTPAGAAAASVHLAGDTWEGSEWGVPMCASHHRALVLAVAGGARWTMRFRAARGAGSAVSITTVAVRGGAQGRAPPGPSPLALMYGIVGQPRVK